MIIDMNKRINSFDLLKAFGIFLVIWGHSIAFLSSGSSDTNHCFLNNIFISYAPFYDDVWLFLCW